VLIASEITMFMKSELQIELQRLRADGLVGKLAEQAAAQGLPPALLVAIASRETNCVNRLGDWQNGEAHGVGIVQIDIQHAAARQARDDGSWRTNPEPLIALGAELLADNLHQAQQAFPEAGADEQMKIAASGYNCGMGAAILGARKGDSDQRTTGRDYGADVMARMKVFAELMGEQSAISSQHSAVSSQ
jgi:Transglycosylase SLT domain